MANHHAMVLLVTHVPDERTIYGEFLRAWGFDVHVVDGPEEAFATAVRTSPHVVVTRIPQPGHFTNGLDLLRRLKQHDSTKSIAVLVITSLMQPEYREQAADAGCDAYLLLPVTPDTLMAEIFRVLPELGPRAAS
jgi:CheY-like chemotaxis protein